MAKFVQVADEPEAEPEPETETAAEEGTEPGASPQSATGAGHVAPVEYDDEGVPAEAEDIDQADRIEGDGQNPRTPPDA